MDKTWFVMPYQLDAIPVEDDTAIRYPQAFAEKFISEFTKAGDTVIDPFAGFGTTIFAAQRLGRVGIGIEYDEKRANYIAERLQPPSQIIHGDSLKLDEYQIPQADFSLTSPPYMQFHHKEHPLTNYTKAGTYDQYLADIRTVYDKLKGVMKHDAKVVLEVSNIVGGDKPMTPLAWDIAREVSKVLFFERELIYCHENGTMEPNTGSHSYCLLFTNK